MGVPPAYCPRPKRHVVHRVAGIPPNDQLRGFSWDANEADLFVPRIAGEDLEAAGQQLHGLVGGAAKPNRLGDSVQHVTLRSGTVSRRHARFGYSNGRWVVANLSRTNPVILNSVELSARDGARDLADGDRLELGEVVLRFHAH